MSLSFAQTWPLLLLPGVLALWWVRRVSLIEFHPRQVDLMILARMIAFVAAVLALAQPTLHRQGSWLAVAYLLDVDYLRTLIWCLGIACVVGLFAQPLL